MGLVPSTRRSYKSAVKHFHTFGTLFNMTKPFPITEHLLCCFAAHLADKGLSPQTGKTYLAGVRNMQLSLGLPDPRDESSLQMFRYVGVSKVKGKSKETSARIRLLITTPQIGRASCMERV